MTQQTKRSILGTAAAVLGIAVTVVGLFVGAGKPALRAISVPTIGTVEATIADTMRAHRRDQSVQIDSIKRQVNAIRCVIDGEYATRYPDACKYGIEEKP